MRADNVTLTPATGDDAAPVPEASVTSVDLGSAANPKSTPADIVGMYLSRHILIKQELI